MEQDDLVVYARSAARAAGLRIDDGWWPAVVQHLATLLAQGALVESSPELDVGEEPAPVFDP